MNIKKVEIVIPINVGEITEKKRSFIHEIFTSYENVNITNEAEGITVIKEKEGLIFTEQGIRYRDQNDNFFEGSILEGLKDVIEKFLLEESNLIQLSIVSVLDRENSLTKSKQIFNEKNENILDGKTNILGIGYRFIIDEEGKNGEIKIEPYIKEDNMVFLEYIIQETCNICELKAYIEKEMGTIKDTYNQIVNYIM